MKKWYWKNGMAFLLAVAMLFSDIVPAAATNDMGETDLPTYDAVSWGDAQQPADVSISDVDIAILTDGIKWTTEEAVITVSTNDIREFTYTADTATIPYNESKDGNYVKLQFKVPADVSANDLPNGLVSAGDIMGADAPTTVPGFFGDSPGSAKEVEVKLEAVDGKGPKLEFSVDWDGAGAHYMWTKFVLDFSAVTLEEKQKEEEEEPVILYPNGRIYTVKYGEIPNVSAYKKSEKSAELSYVGEVPMTWLKKDGYTAAELGITDFSKGYNAVAVQIYAPDIDECRSDLRKTTIDGKAWYDADVQSHGYFNFVKVIDVSAVLAEKDATKRKPVEIKVNWSGAKEVTYVLDFAKATKGDVPEYATPASLTIAKGYAKTMAAGTKQQLDVNIVKVLPDDEVMVEFYVAEYDKKGEGKVDEELLKSGIVQPLSDKGSAKIAARAIKHDGTIVDAKAVSKPISIKFSKVAKPKTVKATNVSDSSAVLTWVGDSAYSYTGNVSVKYEFSAMAGTKYNKNNATALKDVSYGWNSANLTKEVLTPIKAPAPGVKYMVGVKKVIEIYTQDGKTVKLESDPASAKVALTKAQPIDISFAKATVNADFADKASAYANPAVVKYPDGVAKKNQAKANVVYYTSNADVATVNAKGAVTLKGIGTTTISAKLTIPGSPSTVKWASYQLNVTATITSITPKKSTITTSVGQPFYMTDVLVFKAGKKVVNGNTVGMQTPGLVAAATAAGFKVQQVSAGDLIDVTAGDVSGNAIITPVTDSSNGKKTVSIPLENVKGGTKTAKVTLKFKVKELVKPGKPKAVKTGNTGDSLTVSFTKSKYASYYLVQLFDKKGKTAASPQIVLNSWEYDRSWSNNIEYTFTELTPKTKYVVKVQAGYSVAGPKDSMSKVVSATVSTGKLAATGMKNMMYYDNDIKGFKFADRMYRYYHYDVSGNYLGYSERRRTYEDTSGGDVSGGNPTSTWEIDVPYGETFALASVVDSNVFANSTDTLTWTIAKSEKKYVTVTPSKNTFNAVFTGKKTTAFRSCVYVDVKSKNTGRTVATVRVNVVPNVNYGKDLISTIVYKTTK